MEDGKVGEFMTDWFDTPRGHWLAWSERKKEVLMGTARGRRNVPTFRAMDMLTQPQQSLLVLENEEQRIGVESVVGAQTEFRRNIDFQTVYFQFAGHCTIETEFGIYEAHPPISSSSPRASPSAAPARPTRCAGPSICASRSARCFPMTSS